MKVKTIVVLTAEQIEAALIATARSEALIPTARSEAPKDSANPVVRLEAGEATKVSFRWDVTSVNCCTVVELSDKEVKDSLIEAARAAVPEGNGGTEVNLCEDGTAEISFQWSRKAK